MQRLSPVSYLSKTFLHKFYKTSLSVCSDQGVCLYDNDCPGSEENISRLTVGEYSHTVGSFCLGPMKIASVSVSWIPVNSLAFCFVPPSNVVICMFSDKIHLL